MIFQICLSFGGIEWGLRLSSCVGSGVLQLPLTRDLFFQRSATNCHMFALNLGDLSLGHLVCFRRLCHRDELLASRSMHCVGLIYQVLKVFCPGGLQESPGVDRADSSGDGQNGIRCCGCTSGLD